MKLSIFFLGIFFFFPNITYSKTYKYEFFNSNLELNLAGKWLKGLTSSDVSWTLTSRQKDSITIFTVASLAGKLAYDKKEAVEYLDSYKKGRMKYLKGPTAKFLSFEKYDYFDREGNGKGPITGVTYEKVGKKISESRIFVNCPNVDNSFFIKISKVSELHLKTKNLNLDFIRRISCKGKI